MYFAKLLDQRVKHWFVWGLLVFSVVAYMQNAQAIVEPATTRVNVILNNVFHDTSLASIKVTAYERLAGGGKEWRAKAYTDESGSAVFNLEGLAEGRGYFFKTRPPSQIGTAYSADIYSPGDVEIDLGTIQVKVIDFSSQTALSHTKVTLYERLDDESKKWRASGNTDAEGLIRFSPAGLSSGRRYFVQTKPSSNGSVYSADLSSPQEVTLALGTLVVKLRDYTSQAPVTDRRVDLYERLANGSKKWQAKAETDAEGLVRFTPAGLAAGRVYFLKAKPFNTGPVYSQEVNSVGEMTFEVGTLTVTVVEHGSQFPMRNTLVHLYKRLPNAKKQWAATAYTNAEGTVRFTPLGLGDGQAYFLKTKPYDSNAVYSDDMTTMGAMTFKVGTLAVTVLDYNSQTPVPATRVQLYQRLADGSKKLMAKGISDGNGSVRFTPLGLGKGKSYLLRTNPYGTGSAYSRDISTVGEASLFVGTLQVKLLNFISQSPLPDTRVVLYERLDNGRKKWRSKGVTDSNGIIHFTPEGLGEGRSYLLETKPYNAGNAYSHDINTAGSMTFPVGTLEIKLINQISQALLVDTRVTLYERLADGSKQRRGLGSTDENGVLRFTPLGLGTTPRTYFVGTKPYNAGHVYSENFVMQQAFTFAVGTSPVTLVNGDTHAVLAGQELIAYQKLASGDLQYFRKGVTDTNGMVRFDLPFLNDEIYVLRAKNIFGNNKKYFSQVIQQSGAIDFKVTIDGDASLDNTPPNISISSPQENHNVTANGFIVTGQASDDRRIDKIVLKVIDPDKGSNTIPVSHEVNNNNWSASVPASMLTNDKQVKLVATAYDEAQNQQMVSILVSVIEDNTAPEIIITSHTDNQQIPVTGLLLSGMVTDLTQVASLKASMLSISENSSGSSLLFSDQDVTFSQEGAWTLAVNNGQMTVGTTVKITMLATDTQNNAATKVIDLKVVAADYSDQHMINRITFGATPLLIEEVTSIGATRFLEQQLMPSIIDNSDFDSMLASVPLSSKKDLQAWTLMHMIYSKRQLLEVMTWFWDNHFNTDMNTERTNAEGTDLTDTVQYELNENQAFRNNALGNFGDLLAISAKSPAMLIYLDSISNIKGDSNENYARELLELHTLGVDAGYVHTDIEAVAEILTGWGVRYQGGGFVFDASEHTEGAYELLIDTDQHIGISPGGQSQGDLLLIELAKHPATAEFICHKLITLFVSDTPPSTLLSHCAREFLEANEADDQIKQVLTVILTSAEFNDAKYYRAKIKNPVKFIVGAVRNLEAVSDALDLLRPLKAMGITLYENPIPTGWSERGVDWINTSSLIERMKWVNYFARNTESGTVSDPQQLYSRYGYATADGIVGFLMQLSVSDDYSELSRRTALNILGDGFDLVDQGAEAQLRQLHGTVFSFPQYQFH